MCLNLPLYSSFLKKKKEKKNYLRTLCYSKKLKALKTTHKININTYLVGSWTNMYIENKVAIF